MRYALTALVFAAGPAAAKLDYRVEIDAPRELKDVLAKGLNIVRWRNDPEMDEERLKRLVDEAIRESREAAATDGYFSAHVQAELDSSGEPWVVRLRIEPGERTRVSEVDIRFSGPATSDGEARPYMERARQNWTLRPGQPFRQDEWESAKRQAVRDLAGFRYAAASLASSEARIDPETHSASLHLEIASGPPFRFGELHITGTRRYSDAVVANLAPVRPGDIYDREKLILYQRRLLETGYFASVQAEIDQQPSVADAAPLRVSVIEASQHHVEWGVSYNTDVGPRLQAAYTNQDVLGTAWRFGSDLNLDKKIQNLTLNLNTPPRQGGIWDTIFTRARAQDIQNQITREVAVGVSHNYGASAAPSALIVSAHAEDERTGDVASNAHAVYFGARKGFRRTDALVSPRQGYVFSAEVGGTPNALSSQPFLRGVANVLLFFPLGRQDDLSLRGQAGAVRSASRDGIPSTFLFRTGGDQTVRGYAFESIGVEKDGAIVGGRRLLVGSVEYTRWVGESWGVATFFDAGNAWDTGVRTDIATGYGAGVRFRTPIGPIRADLAYGARTSDWRLHFSVGYGF
ncbi:MAG TPA: autotransporter assembly complex family protein [Burkholderiales bacterium]|nr:autotransporter assembly complex family protein [Burkholderiales bacterium]